MHAEAEAIARAALAEYPITPRALRALTSGLINTTWQIETTNDETFILQRLHHTLPPEVNLNLERITRYLAAQGRLTPRLRATSRGDWWVIHAHAAWRLLTYVDGQSFSAMPDLAHAAAAGRMLGEFHAVLADFHEPLPYARAPIHEPARHQAFLRESLARHATHRLFRAVAALQREIESALADLPGVVTVPLRFVHGDPKLSNLLFGPQASPRCLVDLDTLVRAPLAYELGDALRSWCNPQVEDAPTATFDLAIFRSALQGYASATKDFIVPAEAASIVAATELIYLELAMRFGADALNEAYFGWDARRFASRGEHNLRRAGNQLACARLLGQQRAEAVRSLMHIFSGRA
jgi:Ser/Thr protein kinase RdoA (MazF antagonist)